KSGVEGLEANAGGDVQPGIEVRPRDLNVEPGGCQLALGLADVGSILKQLRGESQAERVQVQVEESFRVAFYGLRKATEEKVDPVLDLDDLLIDDQLFALVLANFGLETLDRELGVAAGRLLGPGDLEALLLKRDGSIQVLEPFVERHEM